MASITESLLRDHGLRLSPGEVEAFMVAAIQRLGRVSTRAEPGRDLTDAEAALLQEGGFRAAGKLAPAEDPLFRGVATFWEILTTSLDTAEAARALGVDESRIRQRLRNRTLYGLKDAGSWRLPRVQFEGPRTLPGLETLLPRLPADLHPVALCRWLTSPHPELTAPTAPGTPMSPRAWLLAGHDVAAVIPLAETLALV